MKQGRRVKAKGKKMLPERVQQGETWNSLKEDDACYDIRADDGSDDYIWPECDDEDEDRL